MKFMPRFRFLAASVVAASIVAALGVPGNPSRADDAAPARPETAAPLPSTVDLRPEFEKWGLPPRNQGRRPTCSVFTIAGALELAVARQEKRGERLSVEFLNWAANQTRRGNRDGYMPYAYAQAYMNDAVWIE